MTSPGPGWARGSAAGGRPDPGMRVSDAERSQVADLLAAHYGDGRLDQAEFDERIDHAMKAKTRGELDALLADLPGAGQAGAGQAGAGQSAGPRMEPPWGEGPPPWGWRRRPRRPVPLILLIVLVLAVSHALVRPLMVFPFVVPWLAIAVLAFVWLRGGRRRGRR